MVEYENFNSFIYPLSKSIRSEIEQGQNYFLLINGRPQTFKSLSSLTIANNEDKNFLTDFQENPKSRMSIGNAHDFMHILNNAPSRRGTVVIFDEVGVGVGARDYFQFINKSISKIIQTFGHEGKLIIYTTPAMKFFDTHLRTLVNGYMETQKPDRKFGCARVRFYDLTYSPRYDKVYWKHRRMRGAIKLKATSLRIQLPPKGIIEHYMNYSKPIKVNLREDIEMDTSKMEHKQDEIRTDWIGMIDEAIAQKYLITIHGLRAKFPKLSDGKSRVLRNMIIDECKKRGIDANVYSAVKVRRNAEAGAISNTTTPMLKEDVFSEPRFKKEWS